MRVHIFDQWLYNLDPGIASQTKKKKTKKKNISEMWRRRLHQTEKAKQ